MPTDHACQAAAERAARGIAPVRAVLAPEPPKPRTREDDIPIVIRQYLDPGGVHAHDRADRGGDDDPASRRPREPEPVRTAMGGVVLAGFLDGLRADLSGSVAAWYAELLVRIPHALSVTAARAPELAPPGEPGEWQAMAELKRQCGELLTVLARVPPNDRVNQLNWRMSLVEDAFAGALRRLDVPVDVSVRGADEVASAAGSLFGMERQPG